MDNDKEATTGAAVAEKLAAHSVVEIVAWEGGIGFESDFHIVLTNAEALLLADHLRELVAHNTTVPKD